MKGLLNTYSLTANLKVKGPRIKSGEVSMKSKIDMKGAVLNDGPVQMGRSRGRLRKKLLNQAVCSVAATVGIFGGISSLIAGLICIAIHAFVSGDRVFDRTGTVLLIIAIPMILLGAVFLDEIEPTSK